MPEVHTDLIGTWVRKGGDYARGIVRAVWVTDNKVHVLVQVRHNRHDHDSADMQTWTDFAPSGGVAVSAEPQVPCPECAGEGSYSEPVGVFTTYVDCLWCEGTGTVPADEGGERDE